jgi:hypothetical protein
VFPTEGLTLTRGIPDSGATPRSLFGFSYFRKVLEFFA